MKVLSITVLFATLALSSIPEWSLAQSCYPTPEEVLAEGERIDEVIASAESVVDCELLAAQFLDESIQGAVFCIQIDNQFSPIARDYLDDLQRNNYYDPLDETAQQIRAVASAMIETGLFVAFCFRGLEQRGIIEETPSVSDFLIRLENSRR